MTLKGPKTFHMYLLLQFILYKIMAIMEKDLMLNKKVLLTLDSFSFQMELDIKWSYM